MKKNTLVLLIYLFLFVSLQILRIIFTDIEEQVFVVSNILFSLLVIMFMYSLRHIDRVLLNPIFLASLRMFLLAYGITIFYVYTDGNSVRDSTEVDKPFAYMNNAMIFATIGYISMWYSYHNHLVQKFSVFVFNLVTLNKKILRNELNLRWSIVFSAFVLSIIFKMIMISLGIYGVISTILQTNMELPYLQLIISLSSAGSGALFFLYLYYFKTKKMLWLVVIFFLIDLFFSIITGFKGAIVMCIVVIAISHYIVNNKIKFISILYVYIALKIAYAIITPYRQYVQVSSDFDGTSVRGIVTAFIKGYQINIENSNGDDTEEDKYAAVKRVNFIREITKFQEYKNERGLKKDDPDFVFMILSMPAQLLIPRSIWQDKPKSDLGTIFVTQKVFGYDYNSSSAFGPLGFLYFAGGFFAIIIGFCFIGFCLQIANLFFVSGYWGGILVGLLLIGTSTSLEAQYNFYLINFVYTLLFSMIFQAVIIKKKTY